MSGLRIKNLNKPDSVLRDARRYNASEKGRARSRHYEERHALQRMMQKTSWYSNRKLEVLRGDSPRLSSAELLAFVGVQSDQT